MNHVPAPRSSAAPANENVVFGPLLGAVAGVLISGPYFNTWPLWQILAAIAVCAAIGSMLSAVIGSIIMDVASSIPSPDGEYDDDEPSKATNDDYD